MSIYRIVTTCYAEGMNFLAHLLLAEPTPQAWVGSLMPDMVRGRLPEALSAQVMQAVREHRLVDRLTDTHPAFIELKQTLFVRWGRFSGLLADILLDYPLSLDWSDYATTGREQFIADVYAGLAEQRELMPDAMRRTINHMLQHDWLNRYATPRGIRRTLIEFSYRLSTRFERVVELAPVVDDLPELESLLRSTLARLMPDLQQAVQNSRL